MKEKYEAPEMEVILLEEEDIILTSSGGTDPFAEGSGLDF